MKSRRKNLEAKVLLAFSRQTDAAAEAHAFECHEGTGYQFTVEFFHVTDKRGRHRFINANEFTIKHFGGAEAFNEILGRQFQAFESIGTILATKSKENSQEVMISDPDAAYRIAKRIEEIRNLYPNSTNYLEPWPPRSEQEKLFGMDIEGLIPMSLLFNLGEIGELRIEDLLFGLPDVHVPTMVKPEFVSIVIKRGGARLSELKHDIRSKLEPALIGLKEEMNRPQ